MKKKYDVIGIGSPLLDIIIEADEQMLDAHHLKKGGMHLIDSSQGEEILKGLNDCPKAYVAGGSAANTAAGVALLGGRAAFVGVIGRDAYGKIYANDMREEGVHTRLIISPDLPTGYAITLVTEDGERTFATYLGAAGSLRQGHIVAADIQESIASHIEGYLLDSAETREAAVLAMERAKECGTFVSLDLSAAGIISKRLPIVRDIVSKYADIVFVNEEEAFAFTGKKELEALHMLSESCGVAVVKLGARGSLVKRDGKVHTIDPHPVVMANTNGAGDMYAAGFLHGFVAGHPLERIGCVASEVASLVVASEGARMHHSHHGKIKNILKKYKRCHDA
jgi:sugar/nucleoside kinase (ribokinase family)